MLHTTFLRNWTIFGLLTICGLLVSTPPTNTIAQQASGTVPAYEQFTLQFDVPGDYNNPYDPAEVNITATFLTPDSTSVRVPAFFVQEFADRCTPATCPAEQLQPTGAAFWQVRFTPTEPGEWSYRLSGTVSGDNVDLGSGDFTVEPNPSARGFVRVAENNQYFSFENDEPYFPIGQNLQWSWEAGGGLYTYLDWLDSLAASGANYARLNVDVPWFIGLEWSSPPGQYNDAGQQAAHRLDQIITAAEERGIYLHITLIWHQSFREYTGVPVTVPTTPPRPNISADFDNHPYNSTQGGNLTGAGDILFNNLAQSWLQRRLRYMMARYSYSPAIFAWEIVDAADRIAAFTPEQGLAWLQPLQETIQQFDVNDHLISVGTRDFVASIQGSPLVDFAQAIIYQRRPVEPTDDQTRLTFETLSATQAAVDKPILITEFSLNPWFEPAEDDPTGTHIRNTIWASITNGAAGSAMPYWWDTYIAPQNLYDLYTPLAYFIQGIQWTENTFAIVEPRLMVQTTDNEVAYEPLVINDFNPQFRSASPQNTVYELTADGATPPTSTMSSYLYGQRYNAANAQPEVFRVTPPVDTTMTVRVRAVSPSADARLVITIDDRTALEIDLSAGTSSTAFRIPLSAGAHTVTLDNQGEDWLQLDAIEIAEYRSPLRAYALADTATGTALVWVHHRDYTWETVAGQRAITPVPAVLTLSNMPAGSYLVEFWDPFSGNVIGEEMLTLARDTNGNLTIELLPVERQLALRVLRVAGAETVAATAE
jgi:hypothetical protein